MSLHLEWGLGWGWYSRLQLPWCGIVVRVEAGLGVYFGLEVEVEGGPSVVGSGLGLSSMPGVSSGVVEHGGVIPGRDGAVRVRGLAR